MAANKRIAVFPGSFDPFTKGHFDIVCRALVLFDRVIVAIGHNTEKKRYFDLSTMLPAIRSAFDDMPQVDVLVYDELTAAFAERLGARFLLRGLRNTTDFEFENSVAQLNKHLVRNIETLFLITSPAYASINSSLIREVHRYGGDVSPFIPYTPEALRAFSSPTA